jgi:L-asparaginase II
MAFDGKLLSGVTVLIAVVEAGTIARSDRPEGERSCACASHSPAPAHTRNATAAQARIDSESPAAP